MSKRANTYYSKNKTKRLGNGPTCYNETEDLYSKILADSRKREKLKKITFNEYQFQCGWCKRKYDRRDWCVENRYDKQIFNCYSCGRKNLLPKIK